MLKLENVTKDYVAGTNVVRALKGVSLQFRKSEFVSVLGPSGCGKTTMLNIIGGLDKYTEGDLVINGVSTKEYGDRDWDNYRNHSVGFVFQSYNLIPHQTVVGNVELALTLSGVPKKEKRQRAIDALERVGLGDQINKLPNQLSGGQMQRVAIARALVNNPDIILADEPTGALDSETSVQVMDILKEVSAEKLVIMVTHNPDLAEQYSTRIIRLLDGEIKEDTNAYEGEPVAVAETEATTLAQPAIKKKKAKKKADKRASMSMLTAFSLSLKNLFTKKARTFLTSFAGSIGIIGIALILSLSAGFRAYIDTVQQDALSNYPLSIQRTNMDMSAFSMAGDGKTDGLTEYPSDKTLSSNNIMGDMFDVIQKGIHTNDLKGLKAHLEQNLDMSKVSAIKYSYDISYNIYLNGKQVNPYVAPNFTPQIEAMGGTMYAELMRSVATWTEMMDNPQLLHQQYELIGGEWPSAYDELVLVVDKYNRIADFNLYQMGLKSEGELWYNVTLPFIETIYPDLSKDELSAMVKAYVEEMGMTVEQSPSSWTFDDILGKEYKLLLDSDYYKALGVETAENGEQFTKYAFDNSAEHVSGKLADPKCITLKIKGIVRLNEGVSSGGISSPIAYTPALTEYIMDAVKQSPVCVEQDAHPQINILTGAKYGITETYMTNMYAFGYADKDDPAGIAIYPTTFENKDYVKSVIDDFNAGKKDSEQIKYNDYVEILLGSITVIIDAITYVLIAFVSISLVVSSIMIGIITYISVLERTKEIGVLRSIGASKRDIANVFNAETLLIGFFSGAIGIVVTIILNLILINPIIHALAGISGVASLPWVGGVALVIISMLLTLVAGLIPSGVAARKDPVVALRSE